MFLFRKTIEIQLSFEDKRQGYKMRLVLDTRKSNFGSQCWLWLYTWFIMTLHYRMRQILVQNAKAISLQKMSLHNVSGFSLQNASVITKCVRTVYIVFFLIFIFVFALITVNICLLHIKCCISAVQHTYTLNFEVFNEENKWASFVQIRYYLT